VQYSDVSVFPYRYGIPATTHTACLDR